MAKNAICRCSVEKGLIKSTFDFEYLAFDLGYVLPDLSCELLQFLYFSFSLSYDLPLLID